MVTLAVVAIALGLAVPVFTTVTANNRMSTATNDLVSSLHAARSEALKRRARVVVCATPSDAGRCVAGGSFGHGWMTFVDANADGQLDAGEAVLHRHGAFDGPLADGVSATSAALAFAEDGTLVVDAPLHDFNIQICDGRADRDTGAGIAAGRWIQVGGLGRPQLVRTRAALQSDRNPLGGC